MSRSAFRVWWRVHREPYLLSLGIAVVGCLAVAVALGLDRTLATGLNALAAVVALPFILVAALVVLCMLPFLPLVAIAALADADPGLGDGGQLAEVGSNIVRGYFGWFRRRRHPVFWGVLTGALLALAILGLIGYARGAPERAPPAREHQMRDATIGMLDAQQRQLEAASRRDGHCPDPSVPA